MCIRDRSYHARIDLDVDIYIDLPVETNEKASSSSVSLHGSCTQDTSQCRLVGHSSSSEPARGATGTVLHEAKLRREANELCLARQDAAAIPVDPARAETVPRVVASFRASSVDSAVERDRTAKLQQEANSRLLSHHDATVRLGEGKLDVTSLDSGTTLVRVHVHNLPPCLDKASLSKRTLPKLLRRKLNTLLSAEQRSFGRTVIISEARTNAVIAIWMPGALNGAHVAARELARLRHYVNGGWAKGCAAEPVVTPERLAVLWNSMMRLRAYGLNERCTFVRAEPCGTSYKLHYLNRHGQPKSFQMGAWIDRAQLSRDDLLQEPEYVLYDTALQEAYRRGVTAALGFEGTMPTAEIDARVAKLSLGLLASNFLDSRLRYAATPYLPCCTWAAQPHTARTPSLACVKPCLARNCYLLVESWSLGTRTLTQSGFCCVEWVFCTCLRECCTALRPLSLLGQDSLTRLCVSCSQTDECASRPTVDV